MTLEFATASLREAEIVVVGIPYDRTSSFVPGSRFAPSQIRIGAQNIESYSPYFKQDIINLKIFDAGDLSLSFSNIRQPFNQIQKAVSRQLKNNKKLICLGGEHTITIPIVAEFKKFYPNLNLIQLDAHPDTRDEYLGEKYCHATVIKRISEFLPSKNIFQLGLRSITGPTQNKNQFLFNVVKHLNTVIKQIGQKPCYLTLDIDVVDCGLMPAVQTPIPNGITYQELFSAICKLSKLNFVGCDVVEYNPLASSNLAYASVVAEVLRELILMISKNTNKNRRT
jgi:agmatinase